MSKLFEALQKSGQVTLELDTPLLLPDEITEATLPIDADTLAAFEELTRESASMQDVTPPPAYVPLVEPDVLAGERVLPGGRTLPARPTSNAAVLPFDARSRRSVEQYRVIRTKICHHPKAPQIVGVTSAGPGDGKTVTSINIAGVISLKAGARVLLVDGDLRRSSVARMLGVPSQPGLTEVISRKVSFEDAFIRLEQFPNCFVLTAGTQSQNPPELLDSQSWRDLCSFFRNEFDYVILDTPPVASVADYELIEAVSDGVVMVVRPDHTTRTTFKKAIATIPPAKLLGLVVNDTQDWFLWTVQSGNSYAYYDALDVTQQSTNGRPRG
jgi:capsular exopolysaccharide synthesis family protein